MPNVIEISDFAAPELDVYARLTENQLLHRADPENAIFIAESPMVIERALDAGCVPVSVLMERRLVEGRGSEVLERCGDVPVYVDTTAATPWNFDEQKGRDTVFTGPAFRLSARADSLSRRADSLARAHSADTLSL